MNFGYRVLCSEDHVPLCLPCIFFREMHRVLQVLLLLTDFFLCICTGSRSSLKHSDWGSSGSIPRSCNPVSGGTSTTTTRLHLQRTLSSSIHVPEQETLDVGPTILNPRGEEVDSPVKPDEVQHFTIDCQDVSAKLLNATVPEAVHDVADVESLEINMNPGTCLRRTSLVI